MHTDPRFFYDLAYVFIAAIVGGMLAWRLRQPLILGYVLAGILLSPFTPGPTVSNIKTLELFAEIGVILLMFSVGLEFSLRDLWRVRWVALVGGSAGIGLMVLMGVACAHLLGWNLTTGIVVGAVVSVASTMVLTRLLIDSGEIQSEHGRVMVAITLFEDVAVVIFTVLLPHLGKVEADAVYRIAIDFGRAALVLVPVLFVAARVVPRLLARAARTQNQELFFGVVLAICLGTAALSQAVGLSLALGAFLAGIIISESEYVHEALAQVFPLRDAFVALFFVTIGMLVDPRALFSDLPLLGVMLGLIIIGKLILWTIVVRIFGYSLQTALRVGIGLTQIGEFSFVLVQVARSTDLVGPDIYNATLAAALISIPINAVLFRFSRQIADLVSGAGPAATSLPPAIPSRAEVVICGFGRVGGAIGSALEAFQISYGVIEVDPEIVHGLSARGVPSWYGDAAHANVLEHAGVSQARLLVVALPDTAHALRTVRAALQLQPELMILSRAHTQLAYDSLLQAGATEIVQPELEASITMIGRALDRLGKESTSIAAYTRQLRHALDETEPFRREQGRWGDIQIANIRVHGSPLANSSLRDSHVRDQFGVTVVAVRRKDGELVVNPASETIIRDDDVLRVLGTAAQVASFSASQRVPARNRTESEPQ